jgi:hypothetical protein
LGSPGRARGVAEEGSGVLVEARPVDRLGLAGDQGFVADRADRSGDRPLGVRQHDEGLHGGQLRRDPLDEGREIAVEEQDRAFGVIDRVDDLFVE